MYRGNPDTPEPFRQPGPSAARGRLPLPELLRAFDRLVAQVFALHLEGRFHGRIDVYDLHCDEQGRASLAAPGPDGNGQRARPVGVVPPELHRANVPSPPPSSLAAARDELAARGCDVDPRRIDVYQLGALLLRLVADQEVSAYLRSPKARALVPAELRTIIDRALGYDPADRFMSCEPLAAALAAAGADPMPEPACVSPDRPSAVSDGQPDFDWLGGYRIVERIGRGGMGDVYKAYDDGLSRLVAIKVLPPELARQPKFVQRFRAEAAAVAKLIHPNIVQIHAIGEESGRHFFVMQYVEGESLAEVLARRGRLPADEAVAIVEQCLAGLHAAHRQNLIHRDVKPSNILLDREHDRVLVADFGLVKALGERTELTASGTILGTVDYISPEQARSEPVDARSDLYSLGVLMYQMLAGRLPFSAEMPSGKLFQHAFEQPLPLQEAAADVPPRLAAIVARLLAKDPAERYASAADVRAELCAFRSSSVEAPSSDFPTAEASSDETLQPLSPAARRWRKWHEWRLWRVWLLWRDWLLVQFWMCAPKLAERLQNTEQQVDGTIAAYEVRRQKLAELARDAAEAANEFAAQVESHRRGAADAARRAASAGDDPVLADALRREADDCERTADELASQLPEQQRQADELRGRLAQIDAGLRQLRSQRDVLNLRLRSAQRRLAFEGGQPSARRRRFAIVALGTLLIVGTAGTYRILRPFWARPVGVQPSAAPERDPHAEVRAAKPSDALERRPGTGVVAESANDKPALGAAISPATLNSPRSDVPRRAAEWVPSVGGSLTIVMPDGSERGAAKFADLPADDWIVTRIDLISCRGVTDAGIENLAGLTEVVGLRMAGTAVTDAALPCLDSMRKLESLHLNSLRLSGDGMRGLRPLPALKELQLMHVGVGDAAAEFIGGCTNLRQLLMQDARLTDGGLMKLRALTKLERLNLTSGRITDAGLVALADMTRLKELDLANLPLTGAGFQHLARLQALENIQLTNDPIGDAGLKYIGALAALQVLQISSGSSQVTDVGLAHLSKVTRLRELRMDGARVNAEGFGALTGLQTLEVLSANGTQITDAGVKRLAALTRNLRDLNLGGTRITDAGLMPLESLKRLERLDLRGCQGLTDEAVQRLRRTMPKCTVH